MSIAPRAMVSSIHSSALQPLPLYDLAVIGGGPAGTAAAWEAARRGRRVLMIERGSLPRDRVCGEFVSAEALPLIERMLAAARPGLFAAAPLISGLRLAGRDFCLPRPGRGIPRRELDAALWEAALAAGAEGRLRTEAFRLEPAGDGFRMALRMAAGKAMVAARGIVAAPGRWWRLEGLRSGQENVHALAAAPWVGVKAHLDHIQADAVELYFFSGGYCGLAPVGQGRVNACCLVHRDALHRPQAGLGESDDFPAWLMAAAQDAALSARLRSARQTTPTVFTAPVWLGHGRPRSGRVALAGDAAGFLDPFTGDGIARALLGGRAAAIALLDPDARPRPAGSERRAFYAARALRRTLGLPAPFLAALLRLPGAPALVRLAFHGTRSRAAAPRNDDPCPCQ